MNTTTKRITVAPKANQLIPSSPVDEDAFEVEAPRTAMEVDGMNFFYGRACPDTADALFAGVLR